LAFAVMPPEAIEVFARCVGGLFLKASQSGNVVSITASYSPTEGADFAKVETFNWTPKAALTCQDVLFKKGLTLIPGGKSLSCVRNGADTISIILNTSKGAKTAWIKSKPIVTVNKYAWSYEVKGGPDTNWTICKNQFGDVGGAINCVGDKTCGYETPIRGLCEVRHGWGYREVDGSRSTIADNWSYQVKGGPDTNWTTCNLNGNDVGTPHNCAADNSCDNANAIKGWCAARYSP
jgi:hypothetical protein